MRQSIHPALRIALVATLVAAMALGLASCATSTPGAKGVTQLVASGSSVKEKAVADFQKAVTDSTIPVFVDFYATWCPPCKASAPFIEQLAEEYDGRVLFLRVDTDKATALASSFNIRSIPTFYTIEGGRIQGSVSGYADSMQQEIRDLVDATLE